MQVASIWRCGTGKTHAAASICQVPGLDGLWRPHSQAWWTVLAWLRGSQPESLLLLHGTSYPEGVFFLRQHKLQQSEQEWELYSLVMPGLRTPPMSFVLRSITAQGRPQSQSRLTGAEKWTPPPEQSCGEVTL